jgi:hypothetical protein
LSIFLLLGERDLIDISMPVMAAGAGDASSPPPALHNVWGNIHAKMIDECID